MATREQLEKALRGAHKAGDTAAASRLATELKNYEEPAQEAAEPFDFSAGEMVSNIPSSAVEFGKNMAMPFLHPIDTAKSIGNLGLGVAEKMGGEIESRQETWLDGAIKRAEARGDTKSAQMLTPVGSSLE